MMNPLQSLLGDPAVMSGVPMGAPGVHPPPMPTMAKSASDLESDMKPNKKTPQKKTPNSKKPVTRQEASNGNTSGVSYASVATPQPEAPQLMSPMVFSGDANASPRPPMPHNANNGPGPLIQGPPPM